jgi:maltooligosyltrehalose trehalohydrolase
LETTPLNEVFTFWYPVGAQRGADGTDFRVWAPHRKRVAVVSEGKFYDLKRQENGYWGESVSGLKPNALYQLKVDDHYPVADPASRFQPEGPHGPSMIVDTRGFSWTDDHWPGVTQQRQVIYELHIGTFTHEGTWQAAEKYLPRLADLGITLIEVMPVADFPGQFGWGYDGVNFFAPTRLYGRPDDFRHFVNAAHNLNLGVILDVVYNHAGPDGNYLSVFSEEYFSRKHTTDWGPAINFDGEGSAGTREFFSANAAYWIKEYHLDGLRLDATQNIYDDSADHILALLSRKARQAAGSRKIMIFAENETQEMRLVQPAQAGGYGLDAMWNDDFHHSAVVALTGKSEAYYTDYHGSSQELVSAVKYGFLYQGQFYKWQNKRRGTPALDSNAGQFVNYIENHDQVANSARGLRMHQRTSPEKFRAMTAFVLLAPQHVLLFQGQEFSSTAPFLFFADHEPHLAELVRKGRAEFMQQWRSLAHTKFPLHDPCAREAFDKCKLKDSERQNNKEAILLHHDLLQLKVSDPILSTCEKWDGAVLNDNAFVLRFFSQDYAEDRILIINLGSELEFWPAPQPLLAPPLNCEWEILWSSESPCYGGSGASNPETPTCWNVPAYAALLLKPKLRHD